MKQRTIYIPDRMEKSLATVLEKHPFLNLSILIRALINNFDTFEEKLVELAREEKLHEMQSKRRQKDAK